MYLFIFPYLEAIISEVQFKSPKRSLSRMWITDIICINCADANNNGMMRMRIWMWMQMQILKTFVRILWM